MGAYLFYCMALFHPQMKHHMVNLISKPKQMLGLLKTSFLSNHNLLERLQITFNT